MALATIKPSAFTRVTKPPLTETDSSIIRESAPLVNTTSFNTTRESTRASLRYASASSMARSSNAAEPLSVLSSDGISSSIRISVRNPRLPKLTPRIGMSRSALAIACRHREKGAVPAQYDDQIGFARQRVASRRSDVLSDGSGERQRLPFVHDVDAALREPRAQSRHML